MASEPQHVPAVPLFRPQVDVEPEAASGTGDPNVKGDYMGYRVIGDGDGDDNCSWEYIIAEIL
jgi:hypothetical protein